MFDCSVVLFFRFLNPYTKIGNSIKGINSHGLFNFKLIYSLLWKAKSLFEKGDFARCNEDLEDAFRFAPSVSAKILRLRLHLTTGNMEQAKELLIELLKEHPMYTSFIFESLSEGFKGDDETKKGYQARFDLMKEFFLEMEDSELALSPSVLLTRVRLLKGLGRNEEAYQVMNHFMENNKNPSDVIRGEYIKLLISMDKREEVFSQVENLLENVHQSLTKHFCNNCGYNSDEIFWRCPQCHEWETIQFRWKV